MKMESTGDIGYTAMLSTMIILHSSNIFNFYMGWCQSSGSRQVFSIGEEIQYTMWSFSIA